MHEYQGLEKKLEATGKQLQAELGRKTFWKYFAIVIICICLYEKKSGTVWLPVADSQQMAVVITDWWGLKVQTYYPVWIKPTGETGEYSEQWCIKYPDGAWRVFYSQPDGSPAYTCPAAPFSSYF